MLNKVDKIYAKPFIDQAFEPKSRPDHYPIPEIEDLVFFIQRNYNTDTIVYQLNRGKEGMINLNNPMHPYWIKYNSGSIIKELNYMQKKLAYGYDFEVISNELVEFKFVSYDKRFFLSKQENNQFLVTTRIEEKQVVITHAYIYAEENGVFPDVKFIELYGHKINDIASKIYEKIDIE